MFIATIAGRVGRDAELRAAPSGDSGLNFSVAVSRKTKDREDTIWIDCALWGKRAEALAPYVTKGTALTVLGSIDRREFQKRDGTQGFAITCRVSELTFGGRSGNAESAPAPVAKTPADAPQDVPFDDPIPF